MILLNYCRLNILIFMNNVNITHCNGIELISGSDLNFLYFNARSLKKNFNDIIDFISNLNKPIHLIIVTETWMKENEIAYYNFSNFFAFHSTREESRGGGVAIYVNKSFDVANVLGKKCWNGNNCLLVELVNEKVKICVFYRQPNGSTDPNGSIFIKDLNSFLSTNNNTYVFGDFNFNIFETSSLIEGYKDVVLLNNFQFLNSSSTEFPTRINYRNKTSSCIDHIFTDQFDNHDIKQFSISYFDLVADHKALCLTIKKQNYRSSFKSKNSYTIINHKKITDDKLIESLNSDSFEDLVVDIKNLVEVNGIRITKQNTCKKPYITKEILKFILIKRNYEVLKKTYPLSLYVAEKWKFYRNKVSNLCNKAKKSYYDNYFSTNAGNPKKVWTKINECLGKKAKNDVESIPAIFHNGHMLTDQKSIADALNNYQVNVSIKVTQNCKISHESRINFHNNDAIASILEPFQCPPCTEDEIRLIVSRLKNSNASDCYGLSNNFVKKHNDAFAPILTSLINKQIKSGIFPDCLKIALVKPAYKNKGSKLECKNYRPISILPIFSKIFESVMYRRIYDHCAANKILSDEQFGYVEKSGTEAAMLHTLNDIYQSLDSKNWTALLTLDLTSAFDCLNHEILLIKLRKLQFPSFFIRLIESYFLNRVQSVKLGEVTSSQLNVFCGSPQGGVLSGLFFNIYVNSIFSLPLYSEIRGFCDDMSLIASGSNKDELKSNLESDLSCIDNWLDLHCLCANYEKTKYVVFNSRKRFENFTEHALNISINNTVIERVEQVKIIGLIVDEQLNFSKHIEHVKLKINPFVSKLYYIRRFLSKETALKLYYAHVYSHLIFMNALWSVAPKYLVDTLGVIQRRALRIVLCKERLCSSIELFSNNVLPLAYITLFHECLFVFKMRSNKTKNNILIMSAEMRHSRNTRYKANLIPVEAKTSLAQKNFYYRAIVSFNNLPLSVKKFNSINLFKNRLKEYLFDAYCNEYQSNQN
jgi:Reverse transcriptase (RNA-dependent DNA polymerase)